MPAVVRRVARRDLSQHTRVCHAQLLHLLLSQQVALCMQVVQRLLFCPLTAVGTSAFVVGGGLLL